MNMPINYTSQNNDINLKFENDTFGDWHFKVVFKDNKNETIYSSMPIDLKQGNMIELNISLPVNVNDFRICVFEGRIWKKYEEKLYIPVASVWSLDDEKAYGMEGCLRIEGKGVHNGSTTLNVPYDREIEFMVATSESLEVKIDGEKMVKINDNVPYIPAYHRGNKELKCIKKLIAGEHNISFKITNIKDYSYISILPTAPDKEKNYTSDYLVDCLFTDTK